ncbi:hypothetical protein A7U60_g7985 [Sanghuangporus baumii]|uniref:Uncharacterized protein n=1 Tax=Sanghuangporus baumii TaxID=108892 RepID=A0A9Q5HS67_SANBA|nr:hypothetical protein A7U60_g7985 [Sanghuangporus baumii]
MAETNRVLQAATVLSQALATASIPHAFHGSLLIALLSNSPQCNEVLCIVEGGSVHPFGRIEIIPAGEGGPRRLDDATTTRIRALPFLTVSEFLRAKVNSWALRALDSDMQDIIWVLAHYWQSVDINRIPDQDMERFIAEHPNAAPAWTAIKNRFAS